MSASPELALDPSGDPRRVVRFERADPASPGLADKLVDIDLRCFVEGTYSRYTAAALLHAAEVFLLRAADEVVGSCVVLRVAPVPNEAMVLTMGVLPGWRGRGLGQWFVSCVLDALAEDGFTDVSLLVGSDNTRALHLYRDLGFHVVEEREADPVTGDRLFLLKATLLGR